jgi:hypothetical protein
MKLFKSHEPNLVHYDWSSYHAYMPHEAASVPIEIDWRWLWSAEEIARGADKSAI